MGTPADKPANLMPRLTQGIYPDIPQRVSPNAGGPYPAPPDTIVIHYTAGGSAEGAVATFMNPRKKVSAHLIIDRDGRAYQSVRLTRQAWHAGPSTTPEHPTAPSANAYAIGVELVNWGVLEGGPGAWRSWAGTKIQDSEVEVVDGRGWQVWPLAQLEAARGICRRLRRDLPILYVYGHDEIATPKGRKSDPGEAYPLNGLREFLGLPRIGSRR